jgi:hypothetical protein
MMIAHPTRAEPCPLLQRWPRLRQRRASRLPSCLRRVRGEGLTQQCWWQDLSMSRFVEDIRRARRTGALSDTFRPDDVRRACPGWAFNTYGVFLPKHRRGNPGGYTAYFVQHDDGSYSLLTS